MPFSVGDVDKHKAGLSQDQKEKWVEIANAVLERMRAEGKSEEEAEVAAIRIANSQVGKAAVKGIPNLRSFLSGSLSKALSAPTSDFEKQRFTEQPWDGSRSRFTTEQLKDAVPEAVLEWAEQRRDEEGDDEVDKGDLKLPYREPNGTININAVRNALAILGGARGGVNLPEDVKASAQSELEDVLEEFNEEQEE